jgi:hypothetical protein
MKSYDQWPRVGDRLSLGCSCDAEIVLALIATLPAHSVVRVLKRSEKCRLGHLVGQRVVVRWVRRETGRAFVDVND